MKKCSKCGEIKDYSEFHKNGRASYCKACVKEYDMKRRASKNKNNPSWIVRNRDYLKHNKRECSICGAVKSIDNFTGYIKYGNQQYFGYCKECGLEKQKKWRSDNKDKVAFQNIKSASYKAKWFQNFKNTEGYEIQKSKHRAYYRNGGKEIKDKQRKRYFSIEQNRVKRREYNLLYQNNRYKNDINYKLKICLSATMRQAFKNQGTNKNNKTFNLIGCSQNNLLIHLESQFYTRSTGEEMSWDNYGLYGWHIDHIRPCASFDLTDPEQQKECFHYTNLQPLWAEDNLSKSDKWDG